MGTPYLGEIKLVSFNFCPQGWAFCNGQLLPISQNQAMFALLGTTYGGNGQTNFALPDFRGRVPVHAGYDVNLGETGGLVSHTLTQSEMPAHTHGLYASTAVANTGDPSGALPARKGRLSRDMFNGTANTALVSSSVSNTGGSQPHDNMQPYLGLHFMIALTGVFPAPN
jgi:microcystin-dependent protein